VIDVEPIFNREGRTVGWRKRDVVYRMDGTALGFVFNRVLFGRDGAFLGRFEDDIYRDARGRIVAFEREATGGPLLPVPEPPPVAPLPELRPPVPAWGQVPPPPAMRSMRWSDLAWDDLVSGSPAV
jgi:hypothetical protein